MELDPKKVTAVVCSWNAEDTIEACLGSLRRNGVGKIILVDADSDDNTRRVAARYADCILTDPREGLARARNIGIQEVNGEFVLNFGSDNVLPDGQLEKMLRWFVDKGCSGVSAMTRLKDSNLGYLAWAMDRYKGARYYPGDREVIGTPTLFAAELLKENPYDNRMGWSDDADLCDRLRLKGHKFAVSDAVVYEIGSESPHSVFYRWKGYGRSDWEIYDKYSPTWSFRRRLRSFSHPFRSEFLYPLFRIGGLARVGIIPFLTLITVVRYFSWVKHFLDAKK